jgi:serine/threonine protein kinase
MCIVGRYGASADMWSVGVTLYILLSGTYPFAEERLFTQLESAAYSFAGPEWRHASDAAKDLVARLMELKPERRLSAEAALKHPWIAGSHFSGQVLPSGKLRSTSFDSSPRPQVHQLSWGRPAWLGGGSNDKDVLSISDALPLLNISDGSAPKVIYKSAATAKMEIAASKELPHDAITDFDSPDRRQYVLGKKRDSALQVVEGSAAKRLKIEASDMENNAPNSAVVGKSKPPRQVKKGSKSSLKPDSSRGSQMSIMDAFRGHKR